MEKVIWTKQDNFKSIHKKLLKLKGARVVNKENPDKPFTIFEVGKVSKTYVESFSSGFLKFLNGDPEYALKDSTYNFKGLKKVPMWGFPVEFGYINGKGYKITITYNFMIPRSTNYSEDSKKIMEDKNHPFIFYE